MRQRGDTAPKAAGCSGDHPPCWGTYKQQIMKKVLYTIILPLLTALIWGTAFTMQRMAVEHLSPFSLNGIRFTMGGLLLVAVNFVRAKRFGLRVTNWKKLITGSLCCGLALAIASDVQQFGVIHATAGKAGFITSLYMVLVPVLGLFLKKRVGLRIWISVVIALFGLYFLSVTEGFSVIPTDGFLLCAALMFAVQILFIDYFVTTEDSLCLSCGQFLVAGIVSAAVAFFTDSTAMSDVMAVFWPLMYMGVMSTAIAYTLQVLALKYGDPTPVTLICSLESVFSVAAGALILHEVLSGRELLGCGLMLFAVVLAELPEGFFAKSRK